MQLYNTLTRKKETVTPLQPGRIKLYTCGLTVYSQPHIGNWVAYIYWDILQRTLEAENFTVERVQNITDVGHLVSDDDNGEDKMEKGARLEGITAWEVAQKYTDIANHEAYELLGLIKPTLIKATDKIPQQIEFVTALEKKGYTYVIPGEGVYFDTSKLNDYGTLARLDISGLKEGARVDIDGKKNVTDFALWKLSPEASKRDMEWESPWGIGFPGWHLECSVIAREALGDQIDIHTGGIDHIPVHHTNEIAQTESLTGKQFATYWVHNNHIKVDGGKMSKSVGNIYTLADILMRSISLDAFKLMLLAKHYRTEGNFTWDILEAAQNRLDRWHMVADLRWQIHTEETSSLRVTLLRALSDDLDTPRAVSLIDEYFDTLEKDHLAPNDDTTNAINELLGIQLKGSDCSKEVKSLLEQRSMARIDKDWSSSDALRSTLLESHSIVVRDSGSEQLWSKIRRNT